MQRATWWLWVFAAFGAATAACASTEYVNEGPGAPTDRASGTVPFGELGVCKRPKTTRPALVSPKVWDDAKPCTDKTPQDFVRIGFGRGDEEKDPEGDKLMQLVLDTLRDVPKDTTGGNPKFLSMMRSVRDQSAKAARLKDRVARESTRPEPCDFAFMLDTMAKERARLAKSKCTVLVYDVKSRSEECLIDETRDDAVWITSGWECLEHTSAVGREQSCHRLCAYDDYCAQQVSCAAADVDLLLCATGICVPQAKAF